MHEDVGAPAAAQRAVRHGVAGRPPLVLPQEAAVREQRLDGQPLVGLQQSWMEVPADGTRLQLSPTVT